MFPAKTLDTNKIHSHNNNIRNGIYISHRKDVMIKNLKISSQISLCLSVVISLLILFGVSTFLIARQGEKAAASTVLTVHLAQDAAALTMEATQVQQWFTEILSTRTPNNLYDGFRKIEGNKTSFLSHLSDVKNRCKTGALNTLLPELEALEKNFLAYYAAGISMTQSYSSSEARSENKDMVSFENAAHMLRSNLNSFVEKTTQESSTAIESIAKSSHSLVRNTLIFLVVATLLSSLLGFFIIRSITKPLFKIIQRLSDGSDILNGSASQISLSSQTLAESTAEQAASFTETSTSMEEITSMTRQNADNSSLADNLMKEVLDIITAADKTITEMNTSMEEISTASEATSKIVKTIDEIAFQTNLLALNAAVEAARAGETGAGFAVVADEVRNLAMRAADAAKQTAELIETTVTKVNSGKQIVTKTHTVFQKVAESSTKVGGLIGEISDASREQDTGLNQINQAITQIDLLTQSDSVTAGKNATTSEELTAQAKNLLDIINELRKLAQGTTITKSPGIPPTSVRPTMAKRSKPALAAPPRENPAAPATPKPTTAKPAAKGPIVMKRPEDIIPMDDEGDFEDF